MTRLVTFVCALVVCASIAGPASSSGTQARLPLKTLFKFKSAHGYTVELTAWLYRRERAYLVNSLHAPSGGSEATHFTADSKHPFRLDSFTGGDGCRDIAVFGSVSPAVRKVVAVRKNGTTRTLRRHRPPASWRYRGRLIGAYIGTGSPTVRVRLLGRGGRVIGTFAVLNDLGPTCSTPGQS